MAQGEQSFSQSINRKVSQTNLENTPNPDFPFPQPPHPTAGTVQNAMFQHVDFCIDCSHPKCRGQNNFVILVEESEPETLLDTKVNS